MEGNYYYLLVDEWGMCFNIGGLDDEVILDMKDLFEDNALYGICLSDEIQEARAKSYKQAAIPHATLCGDILF